MFDKNIIYKTKKHMLSSAEDLPAYYIFSPRCSGDFRWKLGRKSDMVLIHPCAYCKLYLIEVYRDGILHGKTKD